MPKKEWPGEISVTELTAAENAGRAAYSDAGYRKNRYIRADVVEQRLAAARAEEAIEAYGDHSGLRINGPDYWREALGAGRYMPKHVGGAHEGAHPITVSKAMKKVEGTLAADVIASLVHSGQIAWRWRDRMEEIVRAEEREACAQLIAEACDPPRDLRAENAALFARLAEAESHLAAMLNAGREASAALAQMGWASSELSDTAFAAAAFLAKQEGSDG